MNNIKVKFKKELTEEIQEKIIKEWFYYDSNWELIKIETELKSYNYNISIKQTKYMKLWDDVNLKIKIQDKLWWYLNHKEIILSFIDEENKVDFRKYNDFMRKKWWLNPNLTKIKNKFIKEWLIKKYEWNYYLNPILWIKEKEISQFLIQLFENEIRTYWVNIKYK